MDLKWLRILVIWSIVINVAPYGRSTNYYFHPQLGNDDNAGTSLLHPFQSLERARRLSLKAGDVLLLAAGCTFPGALELKNSRGDSALPILITSYQWGNTFEDPRAVIDAKGLPNGILLENCSHIVVENIIVKANGGGGEANDRMRCGVKVTTSRPGLYENIRLQNLDIQDVFFEGEGFSRGKEEIRTANGTQRYGWGIRFINQTAGAVMKDLRIEDCLVKNVAHTGIKFTSRGQKIHDIEVFNNRVLKTGGPGIQMSGVRYGHVKNNYIRRSGSSDDSRKWGRGSGLWTWGSSDILIEHNHFLEANGPGDSAGCHIDFNCRNVVVQYNFSADNAGGFCEILGNNYNCAYRYNISVNDGHRVKGKNGAFQEGKTFWLSGYQGKNRKRKGPFNSYFYNNTIYVGRGIISKMAVSKVAEGILVANNIFYIEGQAQAVSGDQYQPEKAGAAQVKEVFFENNLYLRPDNWPTDTWIKDGNPMTGDPRFLKKGGTTLLDYLPQNIELIKDKGIEIPFLPKDSIGLTIGLRPSFDILGTPLSGRPDLGAIEVY